MFGFAPPIQHRLMPGAQSATLAMQQSQTGEDPAAAALKAMVSPKPALPPLAPAQPSTGQPTMMPDTTLPTLVPPTLPSGTGLEDPSASLPPGSMPAAADGLNAAGGDGMAIGDLIAALFG